MTTPPIATLLAGGVLRFERAVALSREDAWTVLTDPERTAQWIGPWDGDPASGEISLTMTAEEPGPPSRVTIRECAAPRRLVVETGAPMEWEPIVTVEPDPEHPEDGERCVVALEQEVPEPEMASMVGPGWDFYLDRYVAVSRGEDAQAIAFEPAYVPGRCDDYRALYAER